MGFIQNHTDYISFLSGLTFFVLASISLVQKFAGENRISWHWLAGFGVLHGLHEWLGVLLRAFEISHLFASFDQLLILASFLALAEFARLNWDKVLIKSTTETQRRSPWILMAGFLVGAALSALRLESVLNGLIFIVVTGAAAWTSALFIRIGQQSNTIGRNSLYLSAGAVALYGLSESLFTLLINSLWFSSLNLAPLTQATSILEAWHGILAFCATIGLWIFIHPEPASKGQDNTANKSSNRYTLWLFTSLLLVLIAGGYATEYLGQKTMESIRGRSHGATEILASHLRDEMARTDLMANLLAKSPLILPALEKRDSESLQQAETALRQHTAVLESSLAACRT